MESIYNWLNYIYYAYKRNNWMLDFSRLWNQYEDVEIDNPIFFLGTHGGGLTLISRMLRRNNDIVSVSGNSNYWSGADEMQVVLGPILPTELSGIKHNVPNQNKFSFPKFKTEMTWLYATDDLIDYYRLTENDFTVDLSKKFSKIIKWIISRQKLNGKNSVRFTDKSQVYTVKVSFINELLKDTDPIFILVTRNPYAICYRAPYKEGGLKKIKNKFSFEKKLELASQHWTNSMKYALADKKKVKNFLTVRFEDVLSSPEKNIKKICEFADIEFNRNMLPQPDDKIPFGSRYRNKWYPLRPDVNSKYFNKMEESHLNIIDKYCHKYANKFGYEKPNI